LITQVQYVSDEEGHAVGVIVPIEFWRAIESERETAYLLKSETMKKRLLEAKDGYVRLAQALDIPIAGVEWAAGRYHCVYPMGPVWVWNWTGQASNRASLPGTPPRTKAEYLQGTSFTGQRRWRYQ